MVYYVNCRVSSSCNSHLSWSLRSVSAVCFPAKYPSVFVSVSRSVTSGKMDTARTGFLFDPSFSFIFFSFFAFYDLCDLNWLEVYLLLYCHFILILFLFILLVFRNAIFIITALLDNSGSAVCILMLPMTWQFNEDLKKLLLLSSYCIHYQLAVISFLHTIFFLWIPSISPLWGIYSPPGAWGQVCS